MTDGLDAVIVTLIGNLLALLGIFIQLTRTKSTLERLVHEIDKRLTVVETRVGDWLGMERKDNA